jgi:ribosomal-protein-alanine N-acetyltransferase
LRGFTTARSTDFPSLATGRLLLRPWIEADRVPFRRLNADPRVMEFFPGVMSEEESDRGFDRIQDHFQRHEFGLFAVALPDNGLFIGFAGLAIPAFEAHFMPCVEIGWRLAAEYWNRGFATEAARAVASYAFGPLQLKELVSFTVPSNLRSRRVMEKLGMTYDPVEDFDHPKIPEGHPLRRHVLYRLSAASFKTGSEGSMNANSTPLTSSIADKGSSARS